MNNSIKKPRLKDHIFILLILLAGIIFIAFLTDIFKRSGWNVRTGDIIWVGDSSFVFTLFFYAFSKLSTNRKILMTSIIAFINMVIAWCGYYYIFLKFNFLGNNVFLRSIAVFLYFFIPLIILLLLLFNKRKTKVQN